MISLNELLKEIKPKSFIICNKNVYSINEAVKSFKYNVAEEKLLINLL